MKAIYTIFHVLLVAPCTTDYCVENQVTFIAAFDANTDCEFAAQSIREAGAHAWCEEI